MKVLVLKGGSQYDTLSVFADEIANGFKKLDFEVHVFDITEDTPTESFLSHLIQGGNLIVSINGLLSYLTDDNGRSVYERYKSHYCGIFVDHPIIHLNRLIKFPENGLATFVDKTHIDYVKSLPFRIGSTVSFLPHAGIISETAQNQDRKDFIFSSSFKNYTIEDVQNKQLPDLIFSIITTTIEVMDSSPTTSFHGAIDQILLDSSIVLSPKQRLNLDVQTFKEVNNVRCSRNRLELLDFFEESEIQVDIYGNKGWMDYCEQKKYLSYKGVCNYIAIPELYSQYKYVINDNNDFPNGSHERFFNAICNSAYPISPSNPYYLEEHSLQNINIFYERGNYENIKVIFENKDDFYTQFLNKVKQSDEQSITNTWTFRAAQIINLIDAFSL